MKNLLNYSLFIVFVVLFLPKEIWSQNNTVDQENIENIIIPSENNNSINIEDDNIIQELENLKALHKTFNEANENDLKQVYFLSPNQINQILNYKQKFGLLVSKYEIQCIPEMDSTTISKLLQIFDFQKNNSTQNSSNLLLVNVSNTLPTSSDFNNLKYSTNIFKIQTRFKHISSNLKWSINLEHDPGEFFRFKKEQIGFDHIVGFIQKNYTKSLLKEIIIGTYTSQVGQGLSQYQRMPFDRALGSIYIKRTTLPFTPFASSLEYNYNNGIAMVFRKKNRQFNTWLSANKVDATIQTDSTDYYFESFSTSGLHRTRSEIENRKTILKTQVGANWSSIINNLKYNVYSIYTHFALPLSFQPNYYNFYKWQGNQLVQNGISYEYQIRNLNSFGEIALQNFKSIAFNFGNILTLDKKIDVVTYVLIQSKTYQAFNNRAFLQNTSCPNNAYYIGVDYHHHRYSNVSFYMNFLQYLQPKYLIPMPSEEWELGGNWKYNFSKKTSLNLRIIQRHYPKNISESIIKDFYTAVQNQTKISIQTKSQKNIEYNTALYFSTLSNANGPKNTTGFTFVQDIKTILLKKIKLNFRLACFENNSFYNRIYVFEPNTPYQYNLQFMNGKGFQLVSVWQYDVKGIGQIFFKYKFEKNYNALFSNIHDLSFQYQLSF